MLRTWTAWILLLSATCLKAQDGLLDALGTDSAAEVFTMASFKSTRVINGHSIEVDPRGVLDVRISHRMGFVNEGISNFFGLDQATIRLGLDYGITDRLMAGLGRSSFQKTVDGFVKYKLLRQCDAGCRCPVSVVLVASSSATTVVKEQLPWYAPDRPDGIADRMAYNFQLLVGRRFSEGLSLQLAPGVVHRNLVATARERNDLYNTGIAGRVKLTRRLALTGEYYLVLAGAGDRGAFHNSAAIGVDIETGGHVFQLHLTNSTGMFERAFITETTGDALKGDIHFGFNISRVFTLRRPRTAP